MKKLVMSFFKGKTFAYLLLAGLAYFFWQKHNSSETEEMLAKQNILALGDSLRVIKNGKEILFTKYVNVKKINNDVSEILKEKDEKILTLAKQIIKLKDISSVGVGTIENNEVLDDALKNLVIFYKDSTDFYFNRIKVTLQNPPLFETKITFNSFSIENILTRNKEGIWSGYVKFTPDYINDFLTVENTTVTIDKDEYVRIQEERFSLSILLGGGVYTLPEVFGHYNVGLEINNKHIFIYSKGINNPFNFFSYTYKFNIFK